MTWALYTASLAEVSKTMTSRLCLPAGWRNLGTQDYCPLQIILKSLFNSQLCTWALQTAGLLGGSRTLRTVYVLGPRMPGETKANPGAPCQVLGQYAPDLSLCAIGWLKVLVK